MTSRYCLLLIPMLAVAGCERQQAPVLQSLPPVSGQAGVAEPRVSGPIGTPQAAGAALVTYGTVRPSRAAVAEAAAGANEPGDISLDFVDTDLREIVAQVLGTILRVNYTIDPAVRGTATLRTVNPISRARVLPALQAVLAQNNATIFESGGLYRVAPAAAAAASPARAARAWRVAPSSRCATPRPTISPRCYSPMPAPPAGSAPIPAATPCSSAATPPPARRC